MKSENSLNFCGFSARAGTRGGVERGDAERRLADGDRAAHRRRAALEHRLVRDHPLRHVERLVAADQERRRVERNQEERVDGRLALPARIEHGLVARRHVLVLDQVAVPRDAVHGIEYRQRDAAQVGDRAAHHLADLRQFLAEDLDPRIGLDDAALDQDRGFLRAARSDEVDGALAAAEFGDEARAGRHRARRRPFGLQVQVEALVERLEQRLVRLGPAGARHPDDQRAFALRALQHRGEGRRLRAGVGCDRAPPEPAMQKTAREIDMLEH